MYFSCLYCAIKLCIIIHINNYYEWYFICVWPFQSEKTDIFDFLNAKIKKKGELLRANTKGGLLHTNKA